MSIKWRVENVTVERTGPTELPVVEASLSGYVDSSRDVNPYSLAGLGRMIEGKLNDAPAYGAVMNYNEVVREKMTSSIFRTLTPMQRDAVYAVVGRAIEEEKSRIKKQYDFGRDMPKIKNVIFNEPATIVFWADGTKTVVKCQDGDVFDPEKGLAMAFMKKVLGNKGNYFETIKKWVPEEYYEEPVEEKRVIIGRVARVETSSDGVNAYVDLNRSVDAKKLVDMLNNTDVTASMDMVCDSWATAVKVIKEGK